MKEKILALLTVAFAGVRKDGLNQLARTLALQATTDDETKALVDKLTKAQIDEFVKEFRAEVDKEVSEGNKTFETNLKKKFDLMEKKDPSAKDGGGSDPKDGDPNDIAALVKAAVADAVKPLQSELEKYKAGDVAKTRLQSLNDKLAACKDDNFKAQALKDFARMQFDTDEAFNEYLTEKETAITVANQNMANSLLGNQRKLQRPCKIINYLLGCHKVFKRCIIHIHFGNGVAVGFRFSDCFTQVVKRIGIRSTPKCRNTKLVSGQITVIKPYSLCLVVL